MEQTLLDLLRLPDVPRVVLGRSPLVLALCQIKFSSVLSVADPVFVGRFQRAIQAQYPVAVTAQQLELQARIGASEAEFSAGRLSNKWQFTDQEDTWRVVLAHDFLAIETRTYEHFDDFIDRLKLLVEALVEHIQPAVATRVGLRYVNELRSSSADWDEIIARDLLGPMAVPELSEDIGHIIQEIRLRYADDRINIRHGFIPGGTTVQPRSGEEPSEQAFYLLDIDAFREFALPRGFPMNPEMICGYIDMYHKAIYRFFRWAVTERHLATMEARRDDED